MQVIKPLLRYRIILDLRNLLEINIDDERLVQIDQKYLIDHRIVHEYHQLLLLVMIILEYLVNFLYD